MFGYIKKYVYLYPKKKQLRWNKKNLSRFNKRWN